MRIFIATVFYLFNILNISAQTIEYFDADRNPASKENAGFYREMMYDEDGKPKGKVKDFWITGELYFEGQLLHCYT